MTKKGISIRTKITLTPILLVAMLSGLIYTYYPIQQKLAAIGAIESKIRSIHKMLSVGVGIGMGETDFVAVSEALGWVKSDSAIVYILVKDEAGSEIATFNPVNLKFSESVLLTLENDKVLESDKILLYKNDIIYQKSRLGTLLIGYSLKHIEDNIDLLRRTTLYFCLAFFLLGGIISILISNRITNNIRKLDEAVRAISEGSQAIKVKIESNDEIGKLATAFNQMVHNQNRSRDELVRYAGQLEKQNQELNQFSYVVSHDLKAPLNAIYKLSQWIEEDLGTDVSEQVRNNLKILRGRIFRLEALINGLLEYSKIGRINIKAEQVDIQEMLEDIIDLINPPSHFNIKIQAGMPIFQTKKILLQQVFFNLLSNAIKYNDKPVGEINITVADKVDFYEFSIADNGPGIDPIYHEKVFVIFQALEARDKVEGTGIGLAIIKKSVEDMGGKIQLHSKLGEGAKFSFTWPK